jgi:hypothetical protein
VWGQSTFSKETHADNANAPHADINLKALVRSRDTATKYANALQWFPDQIARYSCARVAMVDLKPCTDPPSKIKRALEKAGITSPQDAVAKIGVCKGLPWRTSERHVFQRPRDEFTMLHVLV